MINILLLTKGKRIAHRQRSAIFKKWELQVPFPASYKVHTYATCRVHSCYELIKHATSVYIVREQLRCHQPLVHVLARSPIRVVRALFHTRVSSNLNRAVPY